MGGSWRANREPSDMKKDSICEGLLKSPWSDLAKHLVTKNELRAAGWSEAKIKLHLGKPHGRHPSTHFRNPLGQPYWTGQQVLAAAVRAGVLSSEVKSWPYQSPVHGLTDRGWFILAIAGPHGLVMHPELQEALAELAQAKADVVKQAERFTNDLRSNVLANTAETFGPMMVREFRLEERAFPPTIPASECVEKVIWMSGKPKERAEEIRRFTQQQLRLTELQLLASEEEVIEALAEDIHSKEDRYEMIDTSDLAQLCGIEPADGDAERTTYAYWHDLEDEGVLHELLPQLAPYVSPSRFAKLERWKEQIEEDEAELDLNKLTAKEKEVLALLWNTEDCSDRAFRAVCTHSVKSRKGVYLTFEFFVGDGGDIEDECGPYSFHEPGGINCDDPAEIVHPATGNRLADLLYKPRKPKPQ